MSARRFTGERLHEGENLFAVDLARHRAAYEFATACGDAGRVLDLGCGAGYGAAALAAAGSRVLGVDRIPPDPSSRGRADFLLADLNALPLSERAFDLVVSFQVIEHLEDPRPYLDALAAALRPDGLVLVTTPNLLMSDGVNPYHVHEYRAEELAERLLDHFEEVEMRGVGMSEPVRAYMAGRSRRIRRIIRLDALRLRERLPRGLVEKLFAAGALWVRRQTRGHDGAPDVSWRDFPIGPAADDCIDLLALCRRPR